MVKALITRGSIAKKFKINPETLRYYEAQGLIKKPARHINNYRVYDEDNIARIKFILMAKQLGFTLKETKELLSLSITEKSDREKIRLVTQKKSKIIDEKITQLTSMQKVLDELILLCHSNKTAPHCPILKCLYEK